MWRTISWSKQTGEVKLKKKIPMQALTEKAHSQLSELSSKRFLKEHPVHAMKRICGELINELWQKEIGNED